MAMSRAAIGASIKRLEDPPLLRGEGTYLADLALPGMLHAAVLRSPHAHARIQAIDVSKAVALPGVLAALTHADLGDAGQLVPMLMPHPALQARMFSILASDEVRDVGEPVALIVAESRYLAEDALELIDVDYTPLPVANDARDASAPEAGLVHADVPGNLAAQFDVGFGDVEQAF